MLVRLAGAYHRATEAAGQADVAALPARLDQIDAWIEEGLTNGAELNAADFQLGVSVSAILRSADPARFIEGRPAEALARRARLPRIHQTGPPNRMAQAARGGSREPECRLGGPRGGAEGRWPRRGAETPRPYGRRECSLGQRKPCVQRPRARASGDPAPGSGPGRGDGKRESPKRGGSTPDLAGAMQPPRTRVERRLVARRGRLLPALSPERPRGAFERSPLRSSWDRLVRFPQGAVDDMRDKNVVDAALRLYGTQSGACDRRVQNHRLTASFDSSTVWANQPAYSSTVEGSTTRSAGDPGCPADDWVQVNVSKATVDGWADGAVANRGLLVRAADGSEGGGAVQPGSGGG